MKKALHRNGLVAQFAYAVQIVVMVFYPALALAGPDDPTVVGGEASVTQPDANTTLIQQGSDSAIIHWRGFSIDVNELVRFEGGKATLNRVTGGDPSSILGQLIADHRIFIVNQNGVVFGPESKVDVAGLVATTFNIENDAFMNGDLSFAQDPSAQLAAIVNQGEIRVSDNGFVFLVAPAVSNEGLIIANLGQVVLGAGSSMTLDFNGDGLVTYQVQGKVLDSVVSPDGSTMRDAVANSGTIQANGGTVVLHAQAAGAVFDSLVNNSGVIEARSLENRGGVVVLEGSAPVENTGEVGWETHLGEVQEAEGVVLHTGEIDVAAIEAGAASGTVAISGQYVGVSGSIDAQGGGNVLVTSSTRTVLTASASIDVSGQGSGSAGSAVVWSDEDTLFYGSILGRGGDLVGDGAVSEVSGYGTLSFDGRVDLTAANGVVGTLLLDPSVLLVQFAAGSLDGFLPTILEATGGAGVPGSVSEGALEAAGAAITLEARDGVSDSAAGSPDSTLNLTQNLTIRVTNSNGTPDAAGITFDEYAITTPGSVTMQGDTANGAGSVGITLTQSITSTAGSISISTNDGNISVDAMSTVGATSITITSANGSITDVGVNVLSTSQLTLNAGTSIGGGAGAPIDCDVASLIAFAQNGNIDISDTGATGLIVESVIGRQGGGPPAPDPVLGAGGQITTNGGNGTNDVRITAAGNVVLGTAKSPDALTISTTVGTILDGNGGTNNLLAQSVTLSAPGAIGQSADAIDVISETTTATVTTSGGVFLGLTNQGTVNATGLGAANDVAVTANIGGPLVVGAISSGQDVTITLNGGVLSDADGAGIDITAGRDLTISANDDVGTSGDPIETDVTRAIIVTTTATSAPVYLTDIGAAIPTSVGATVADSDVRIRFGVGPDDYTFVASSNTLTGNGSVSSTGLTFSNTSDAVLIGAAGINAGTGDVTLTSFSSITCLAGSGLTADDAVLSAGTFVGVAGTPILTSVTTVDATANDGGVFLSEAGGLTLNAQASGGNDVTVEAARTATGDLTVDTVSSAGIVTLFTNVAFGGNIFAAPGGSTISGTTLNLTANEGAIGTAALPLGTAGSTISATTTTLTATAHDVFIDNTLGLTMPTLIATGDIVITAGGNLSFPGGVSAPGRAVTLDATGTLSVAGVLTANSLDVTARVIGASGAGQLPTAVSTLQAASTGGGIFINNSVAGLVVVSATAVGPNGDVEIVNAGNMVLGKNVAPNAFLGITAAGDDVTLTAAGAGATITDNNDTVATEDVVNVTAKSLSITALGGIGTPANRIEVDVDTLTATGPAEITNAGDLSLTAAALLGSGSYQGSSITIQDLGGAVLVGGGVQNLTLRSTSGGIVMLDQTNTLVVGVGQSITIQAGTVGSGATAVLGNLTTAGGNITITSDSHMTIGTLNAGAGDVFLTSNSGIILDGNGAATDNVIAANLTISGITPSERDLHLDQETWIARAEARDTEVRVSETALSIAQTTASSTTAAVTVLTAEVTSNTTEVAAAQSLADSTAGTATALAITVTVLNAVALALDIAAAIAELVAAPAQAIPLTGDGGAMTVYAGLDLASKAAATAAFIAQIAADDAQDTATDAAAALLAEQAELYASEIGLQVAQLIDDAAQDNVGVLQSVVVAATVDRDYTFAVRDQMIAAADAANVVGTSSTAFGVDLSGTATITAGNSSVFLSAPDSLNLGVVSAANTTNTADIVVTAATTAPGNINVNGLLSAPDLISLTAGPQLGSILEGAAGRISSRELFASSAGAITITNGGGNTASVSRFSANNAAGTGVSLTNSLPLDVTTVNGFAGISSAGGVTITNTGTITLTNEIAAAGQTVALTSTGAILSGSGGANNVTADTLSLHASTGIGTGTRLRTIVSNLEAQTSASGGISISNTGALTLLDTLADVDVLSVSAPFGAIDITTGSPMDVTADMTSATSIVLAAGEVSDSPAFADRLTIDPGITVMTTGAGSSITLQAGDAIVIGAGATVTAVALIIADSGAGSVTDLDGQGIFTNDGTLNAPSITINAFDSVTTGNLTSTASGTGTLTVSTSADITVGNLSGAAPSNSWGNVILRAGIDGSGNIIDGNVGANNVASVNLTATAGGGGATAIELDTTITTLTSAEVANAGNVILRNVGGGLTVTQVVTGTVSGIASGDITISTSLGALTIASPTGFGASSFAASGVRNRGIEAGVAFDMGDGSGGLGNVFLSTTDANDINVGNGSLLALAGVPDIGAAGGSVTLRANTAGGVAGQVRDGDTFTDVMPRINIIADGLRAEGAGGFGTAPNPFETFLNTVSGRFNANGWFLNNKQSVIVGTVDTVAGIQDTDLTATFGNVMVRASNLNDPAVTVAADMIAAGQILVQADETVGPVVGDNLTVNAGIRVVSTTAAVLMRAGDNVLVSAGAQVVGRTTTEVTAGSGDNDSLGDVLINGTVGSDALSGINGSRVDVTAIDFLGLSPGGAIITTTAGALVTLVADSNNNGLGNITDSDATVDIQAATLRASAASVIDLDTDVTTLSWARLSGLGGIVDISEFDTVSVNGLAIGEVTALAGVFNLTGAATTAITDANGNANNVSADRIVINITAGFGTAGNAIETTLRDLTTTGAISGSMNVMNDGALTVGAAGIGTGGTLVDVTLRADSISMSGAITASGTVSLTATDGDITDPAARTITAATVDLAAGGSDGDVGAVGAPILTSATTVLFAATGSGEAAITDSSLATTTFSGVSVSGNINLSETGGSMQVGAAGIQTAGSVALTSAVDLLDAAGGVVGGASVTLTSTSLADGDIGAAGAPVLTSAATLAFTATLTGDVFVTETNGSSVSGVTGSGGITLVSTTGDWNVSGAITTTGAVSISSLAGDVLMTAGVFTVAGATVTLAAGGVDGDVGFTGGAFRTTTTAAGALSFTASGGGETVITEADGAVVTGAAGTGNVILSTTTGAWVVGLAGIAITGGGLTMNALGAGGSITDVAGAPLSVGGLASFNTVGVITLGDAGGGATNFGSLTLIGTVATVREDSSTVFVGASALTTLALTSASIIDNQANASLSVTGNASFTGTDMNLGNASADAMNFGTLTVNGTSANVSENSATTATGANALTAGFTLSSAGAIDTAAAASVTADSLAWSASGTIADGAGTTFAVTGLASFNAGANAITLGDSVGDATNFGSLGLTGTVATVTEDTSMVLAAVSVSTLVVTATTNPADTITDSGSVIVTGTLTATASAGVILDTPSNDAGTINIAAGTGGATFTDANAFVVGTITAGTGVVLTALGASVTSDGLGIDVTAPTLSVSAVTGIGSAATPLTTTNTAAAAFGLEATTSTGGVFVTNTGPLVIGGVTALQSGVSAIAGDIRLVTIAAGFNTPMTMNESVSTSGAITLTAGGIFDAGPACFDDLTVALGAAVVSSGSSVTLNAEDDVIINGTVSAGTTLSLNPGAPVDLDNCGSLTYGGGGALFGIDVVVTSPNDVDLGTIVAVNSATVTAGTDGTGSVTDNNGALTNIFARSLSITAANSIDTDVEIERLTLASLTNPANAGTIDISDRGGDMTIDVVMTTAATDAVTLSSTGGLTDGNAGAINVTTPTLTLTAGTGVIDLDTSIATLAAANVTGAGPLDITNATAWTIGSAAGNVSTANGNIHLTNLAGDMMLASGLAAGTIVANSKVTLTSAGAILDANAGALNVSADQFVAIAGAGIGIDAGLILDDLESNVRFFEARAGAAVAAANGIFLRNTGNLTLGGIGVLAGVTGGGAADLRASSPMVVSTSVIMPGTVQIVAGESADPDDNIAIQTGVVVQSTTANVNVFAGDNIVIGGQVLAVTSVNLEAGRNALATDTDGFGSVTSANGSLSDVVADSLTALSVGASAGNAIELDTTIATLTRADVSGAAIGVSTGGVSISDTAGGVTIGAAGVSTTRGNVSINATGGNLTFGGVVTAAGAGADATLSTTGSGDIVLAAVAANVTATDVVNLSAAGSITDGDASSDVSAATLNATAGTGIDVDTTIVTLSALVTGAGAIDVSDSAGGMSVLSASTLGAGTITLAATAGDLALGTVSASAGARAVNLTTSASGAITDLNGGTVNVIGSTLTATAVDGIDTDTSIATLVASVTGTGAIDVDETDGVAVTSATTLLGNISLLANGDLTATLVTASTGLGVGSVDLTSVNGNMILGSVTAAGDRVDVTAGREITDGLAGEAANVTALSAVLLSGAGLGTLDDIDTVVTNLEGSGGSGAFNLSNDGALTIGGISSAVGFNGHGDITITASSPLTINEVIDSESDVTLTAGEDGDNANLDQLTINASVSGHNVTLNAGDDVIVNNTVRASENLAINAGDGVRLNDFVFAGELASITTGGTGFGANDTAPTCPNTLVFTTTGGVFADDILITVVGDITLGILKAVNTVTVTANLDAALGTGSIFLGDDGLGLEGVIIAGTSVTLAAANDIAFQRGGMTTGGLGAENTAIQFGTLLTMTAGTDGTGAITDSNVETEFDVTGRDVTASSTAGAGITFDAQIDTLNSATSTSGAIDVSDDGGNLSIGTVTTNAASAVMLTATGAITDLNGAAANNVTGASLVVTTGSGVNLNTAITAGGTLTATASGDGDINVRNSTVGGGLLTVTAASVTGSGDVTVSNTSSMAVTLGTAANGDLTLTTTALGLTVTTATSGNGGVNLTAATDLATTAVSSVNGHAVLLAGGVIVADTTTATNGDVRVTAGTTVTATTTTTTNGDAIFSGSALTLTTVTAGGAGAGDGSVVATASAGNILLDTITAAGDSVSLTATGGAINEAAADGVEPTADIVADSALLSGTAGVGTANGPLEVNLSTLSGRFDANGFFVTDTAGGLAVGTVAGVAGVVDNTLGSVDAITIRALSPLTIAANVTGSGTVTLGAGESATPSVDNLTINGDVLVSSSAANVVLSAGDNVDIFGFVSAAAGVSTITAGAGDLDASGSITNVENGISHVTLTGGTLTLLATGNNGSLGINLDTTASTIDADVTGTTTGGISIDNTASADAPTLTVTSPSTAATTGDGSITLTNSGGDMTVASATTSATTGTGDVTIEEDGGALTVAMVTATSTTTGSANVEIDGTGGLTTIGTVMTGTAAVSSGDASVTIDSANGLAVTTVTTDSTLGDASISVENSGGGAGLTTLTATTTSGDASVDVSSDGGTLAIGTVTTSSTLGDSSIDVDATGGDTGIATLSAATTSGDGSISVDTQSNLLLGTATTLAGTGDAQIDVTGGGGTTTITALSATAAEGDASILVDRDGGALSVTTTTTSVSSGDASIEIEGSGGLTTLDTASTTATTTGSADIDVDAEGGLTVLTSLTTSATTGDGSIVVESTGGATTIPLATTAVTTGDGSLTIDATGGATGIGDLSATATTGDGSISVDTESALTLGTATTLATSGDAQIDVTGGGGTTAITTLTATAFEGDASVLVDRDGGALSVTTTTTSVSSGDASIEINGAGGLTTLTTASATATTTGSADIDVDAEGGLTVVTSLTTSATTGDGSIFVESTGGATSIALATTAVTLGDGSLTVDATGGPTVLATLSATAVGGIGSIDVTTSGGTLTLGTATTTAGAGDASLDVSATGGATGITALSATTTTGDGSIRVDTESALLLGSATTLATLGDAQIDITGGGGTTTIATLSATATDGNSSIDVDRDGGALAVTAALTSIADGEGSIDIHGDGGAVTVTTATATATAGGDVDIDISATGTVAAPGFLLTAVTITSTGIDGDVSLSTTGSGNMSIDVVTALGDRVTLDSTGNVTDGDVANDISALELVVVTDDGFGTAADPFETTVSFVEGTGGTLAFEQRNDGALTIGILTNSEQSGVTATTEIDIRTTGAGAPRFIGVVENVESSASFVTLIAIDTAGAGFADDVSIDPFVTVTAATDLTVSAGDDIVIAGTLIFGAAGGAANSATLTSGAGDVDTGGSIVDLNDLAENLIGLAAASTLTASAVGANAPANGLAIDLDTRITTVTAATVGTAVGGPQAGGIRIEDTQFGLTVLSATTEFGSVTLSATGGNLDIAGTGVTASTAGGLGNIILDTFTGMGALGPATSGNITLGVVGATTLTALGDLVELNSVGNVSDAQADGSGEVGVTNNISAASLLVRALLGFGTAAERIETTVDTVAGIFDQSGFFMTDLAGGLTLGTVTSVDGSVVSGVTETNLTNDGLAGADITIQALSPLFVLANVVSAGDILLIADEVVGAGDNLIVTSPEDVNFNGVLDAGEDANGNGVLDNVTVLSTLGDIELQAGDNVLTGTGAVVTAFDDLTIRAGFDADEGDVDGLGSATLLGTQTSQNGTTTVTALGDILLGLFVAGDGLVLFTEFGNILDGNGPALNVQANGLSTFTAVRGVIGIDSDAIEVEIQDGQLVANPGGASDRVSVSINGDIEPDGRFFSSVAAPGLELFNNTLLGGDGVDEVTDRFFKYTTDRDMMQGGERDHGKPGSVTFLMLYIGDDVVNPEALYRWDASLDEGIIGNGR